MGSAAALTGPAFFTNREISIELDANLPPRGRGEKLDARGLSPLVP